MTEQEASEMTVTEQERQLIEILREWTADDEFRIESLARLGKKNSLCHRRINGHAEPVRHSPRLGTMSLHRGSDLRGTISMQPRMFDRIALGEGTGFDGLETRRAACALRP